MMRVRFTLPAPQSYHTQDLLHDALVAAFEAAGASPEQLIGSAAFPWTFAPLTGKGRYCPTAQVSTRQLHGLVVSSPHPEVAGWLQTIQGEQIACARASASEMISLKGAVKQIENAPIANEQEAVAVHWLSPLVTGAPRGSSQDWLVNPLEIEKLDPNAILSRRTGRPVSGLRWMADRLAARGQPSRACVDVKVHPKTGQAIWATGTKVPFVLSGPSELLRLAWYAGLGAKGRMGFGCWDTEPYVPAPLVTRGEVQ